MFLLLHADWTRVDVDVLEFVTVFVDALIVVGCVPVGRLVSVDSALVGEVSGGESVCVADVRGVDAEDSVGSAVPGAVEVEDDSSSSLGTTLPPMTAPGTLPA